MPKVCIVAEYPYSLATGGLQVQATSTLEALRRHEPRFDYRAFDWLTEEPADLYHFIGLPRYLMELAHLVELAGKPYVCTFLLGQRSNAALWARDRLKRLLSSSSYSKTLGKAAHVFAIHETARRSIISSYGLAEEKVSSVPHGISEAFFQASPEVWKSQRGDFPFLLCVGAIQPRKNQLLLVEAANTAQLAVVLIGPVLPGHESYARKIEAAMQINQQWQGAWIPGLSSEDPLLVSAYAACRTVVLLSEHETQPISILQAMATAKPALLADAPFAYEPPFASLPRVSLRDPARISEALRRLWRDGTPSSLEPGHRWPDIARELARVYASILAP
jgi:glycosyltransferase involved in cell wall biosynthesis